MIMERQVVEGDKMSLHLYISWENVFEGDNMRKQTLIQNYAQWSNGTGEYHGVSCNVVYYKNNIPYNDPGIINYVDNKGLRNADPNNDLKWNNIGPNTIARADEEWFKRDTYDFDRSYGRTYIDDFRSTANCAAYALIYQTVNGEPTEETALLNEAYWLTKNDGPVTVWTGVRVYESANEKPPMWIVDAEPVEYTMQDWGLEDGTTI